MANRRRWVFGLAFLVALAITSMFAMRAMRAASHLRGGDEPIRPWMSVPYIAHAYGVPPPILFEALGIPPDRRDRRPIMRIAREQDRPVDLVIGDLMVAILTYRLPPPPLPPLTPVPPATPVLPRTPVPLPTPEGRP